MDCALCRYKNRHKKGDTIDFVASKYEGSTTEVDRQITIG